MFTNRKLEVGYIEKRWWGNYWHRKIKKRCSLMEVSQYIQSTPLIWDTWFQGACPDLKLMLKRILNEKYN